MYTEEQEFDISAATSVRNTFIDWRGKSTGAERRNKSLPPSFKPDYFVAVSTPVNSPRGIYGCYEWSKANYSSVATMSTDDSTDARTEISDDDRPTSELGNASTYTASTGDGTPTVYSDMSQFCVPCDPSTGIMYATPDVQQVQNWLMPVPVWTEQLPQAGYQRLSSTAAAFQPTKLSSKASAFQPATETPAGSNEKSAQVVEMMDTAKAMLAESNHVKSVDVSRTLQGGWSIIVEAATSNTVRSEVISALAKDALLKAAEQSRNVYVLGYVEPDVAFVTKPTGFDVQLGVMDSMQTACWVKLKRGTCNQRTGCYKQHPALEIPVQVHVESANFTGPNQIVHQLKQDATQFMFMLAAMLTNAACGAGTQAFCDEDGQGWRVEISVRAEDMCLKEHILALAKTVFTEAAKQMKSAYIMGSGATPFVSKSNGFMATLGEMTDQSQICWDIYHSGACWREHSCRWQHPQCSMPLNVVLKALASP